MNRLRQPAIERRKQEDDDEDGGGGGNDSTRGVSLWPSKSLPGNHHLKPLSLHLCVSKCLHSSLFSLCEPLCRQSFVSNSPCCLFAPVVVVFVFGGGERVFAQADPTELGCQKVGAPFTTNSIRTMRVFQVLSLLPANWASFGVVVCSVLQ